VAYGYPYVYLDVLQCSEQPCSACLPPDADPVLLDTETRVQGAHLKALLMAMRLNDPKLVQHVVLR
jgi:hypothetical protein